MPREKQATLNDWAAEKAADSDNPGHSARSRYVVGQNSIKEPPTRVGWLGIVG